MKTERPERGFITFKAILALLFLASLVFLALKLLPPFISNYQLQDAINNIAFNATYAPVSEEEIKKSVISRAKDSGVDLAPKQVSVRKGGGSVDIAVQYTVPVDLLVQQVELHFEPSASNRNITMK